MYENDDAELMKQISDGNHSAFTTLVRKYTKYFYAIAYRHVSNKGISEDIIQQSFLKVWECPYKFDSSKAQFKTWFARIVINLCLDYNRKNEYNVEYNDEKEADDGSCCISVTIEQKQKQELLEKSIHKLPASQQMAINLGFYQGLPYAEVAKIIKVSEPAVKSLIMRAKDNIRKYMQGEGYVE